MAYNINLAISSFKDEFKKFESEKLFDQTDHTKEYTDQLNQKISNVFQIITLRCNALLRGQKIGGETPDFDQTAEDLTVFVKGTIERTSAEFERKLNKKRLIRADSRKGIWEQKQVALDTLVKTLTQNISALKGATEITCGVELKNTLRDKISAIKTMKKRISSVERVIQPLEGPQVELIGKIVQEKERHTAMIHLLGEAKDTQKSLEEVSKVADVYCKPNVRRAVQTRGEHRIFSDLKDDLEWDISSLESFGNTILHTYRERIREFKALRDKYTPAKLESLREGRADLKEVRRDFDELSILVFYLRQMLDVNWDEHSIQNVREAFEDIAVEVAPLCDRLTEDLVPVLQTALRRKMDAKGKLINDQLLHNQIPEIKKTIGQKLWGFLCWFCSAIASIFCRKTAYED